jgi:hypothetical protein
MGQHIRMGEEFGWFGGWSGMFLWVMIKLRSPNLKILFLCGLAPRTLGCCIL